MPYAPVAHPASQFYSKNRLNLIYQRPNNPKKIYWLGKPKSQIIQELLAYKLTFIHFASWLAVPSLGILIKFRHQICQCIDYYSANSVLPVAR